MKKPKPPPRAPKPKIMQRKVKITAESIKYKILKKRASELSALEKRV